jgi:tetratricopeptide (TPR) repeat protein
MNRLKWAALAVAFIATGVFAARETKAGQQAEQPVSSLKALIVQGNTAEAVRIAHKQPETVAPVLKAILEEVDLQITDRKIAEARSALEAAGRFVSDYAPDGGKGMPRDEIQGRLLRLEGIQLSDDKQYEQAEAKLKLALEVSARVGDQRLEAGVHNNLGYALQFQQDRLKEAAAQYNTARTMAEEQKDPLRAGSYNFNLGLALLQLGNNDLAFEALKRSAEQNRSVSKTSLEARATLYQGVALGKIKPTSKEPIPYFVSAEKMFEQLGDDHYTALSYWMMAQQTAFTGDMPEAARVTEKAIPYYTKAGDKAMLAGCYAFAAEIYGRGTSAEDKEKAEKYKKLAEELKKEIEK